MSEPKWVMPQPGDRLPPCFGVAADGKFYSLEAQYGRSAAMILAGAAAIPSLRATFMNFIDRLDAFAVAEADVMVMVDDNPALSRQHVPLALQLIDCGRFLASVGVGPSDALVIVTDRNMRTALIIVPNSETDIAGICLDALSKLPNEAARDVQQPAPAIILPNLISPAVCRDLIEWFGNSQTMEGEVARTDAAGIVTSVVDHDKKRRREMPLTGSGGPGDDIQGQLIRHCAPEIAKAFQVHVTHIDRILLARYDQSGGWFRRHRDNSAENVAFREFAISINLNAGQYEGGSIIFPEYSWHRFGAPTGGGLIFSASLLHEVTPITRGSRYVLLSFLHGDAAEQRRRAYVARSVNRADRAERR